MSKNKYKYYLKIINLIEKTRTRNNKNWMDLLRLSFKYNIPESKKIVNQIFKEDKKISSLIKKLAK
tara:strand:+ start:753 stop:950 length:198 start_codon:yes stop_codon:yes gene_type:complete